MLISCPKCHSVYDITNKKIPENGKKFKCAECGDIWTVYPSDETTEKENQTFSERLDFTQIDPMTVKASDITEPGADEDLEEMFNLLSRNTKTLFASGSSVDSMNIFQKIRHYVLNSVTSYAVIAFLLSISIILAGILLYRYRYNIAAKIPGTDYIYAKMNMDSLYRGKDLTIEDVNIRNIRIKGHSKVEISGRIFNNGSHIVTLLPIKAAILDTENQVVDETIEMLKERQLEPNFGALFRIVMKRPDSQAQKVRLSLEKDTETN